MGLPAGTEETIFQPFGRAENATTSHISGMGLGLYICRQIMASHNGRIWAQSAGLNQGTVVHLWLPSSGDRHQPAAFAAA
jgi:signal transduction histidine kinase